MTHHSLGYGRGCYSQRDSFLKLLKHSAYSATLRLCVKNHAGTGPTEAAIYWLSRLPVGFGQGVAVVAEADAATRRIWWGRELLDEVGHAALDLLDVTLGGIHAALELGNPLNLIKPVQQHLAKDPSCPLTKACALD